MMAARRGGPRRSAVPWLFMAAVLSLSSPVPAGATVTPSAGAAADCRVACGLVLGVTSFTVATGSVVTWGRLTGGIPTQGQGTAIWTIGFGASLAVGAGLYGDRRERAIFASGVGIVAGALAGFTVESLAGSGERSTKIAATLIGAAAGALAGGIYGALSHESDSDTAGLRASRRTPLLTLRFSH